MLKRNYLEVHRYWIMHSLQVGILSQSPFNIAPRKLLATSEFQISEREFTLRFPTLGPYFAWQQI